MLEIRQFEATKTNLRVISQPSVLQIEHLLRQGSLESFSRIIIDRSINICRGFSVTNLVQTSISCLSVIRILQTIMIDSKTESEGHFNDPLSKISMSLYILASSGSNNKYLSIINKTWQTRQCGNVLQVLMHAITCNKCQRLKSFATNDYSRNIL